MEICVPASGRSEPSSLPVDWSPEVEFGRGEEVSKFGFTGKNSQSALIQNQKQGEIWEVWSGGKGQFYFLPSSWSNKTPTENPCQVFAFHNWEFQGDRKWKVHPVPCGETLTSGRVPTNKCSFLKCLHLKQFVFAAAAPKWADVPSPHDRVFVKGKEGRGGVELHFKHLSSFAAAAAGSCGVLWLKSDVRPWLECIQKRYFDA